MDYCCICGQRIQSGERKYRLSKSYPDDYLCIDCVDCLKEASAYANAGSLLFKASRKEIAQKLNRGMASENALDYCEQFLSKLNSTYRIAADSKKLKDPTKSKNATATKKQPADTQPSDSGARRETNNGSIHHESNQKTTQRITPSQDNQAASQSNNIPPSTTIDDKHIGPPSSPEREVSTKQVSESIICKKCEMENLPDSQFCEYCATPLKAPKYCRFCGGEMSFATDTCKVCMRDRKGALQQKSRAQIITDSARDARKVVSTVAAKVVSPQQVTTLASQDWTQWVSAAIALLLGIMLMGKMITIPVVKAFSGNRSTSSFSYFEVSEMGETIYDAASMFSMSDKADALKLTSIIIVLVVLGVLLSYCAVLIAPFRSKLDAASKLRTASKLTILLQAILLLMVVIINQTIKEKSSGLVSVVMKPTPLCYILFAACVLVALFVSKELQYRSAIAACECGNNGAARTLFAELADYKDVDKRLAEMRIADDTVIPPYVQGKESSN